MKNKSGIRTIDMELINDLFEMHGGYVLDFSNPTYSVFFDEIGINIDHPHYSIEGESKAKRLRFLLRSSMPDVALKVLLALWEYRETKRRRNGIEETIPNAQDEFYSLIERLGGERPNQQQSARKTSQSIVSDSYDALIAGLMDVSALDPQPRGYAFERFLKGLFDANNLSARASFRLVGEQIDGSLMLDNETYLLEAKWCDAQTGVADLHTFNGKVQEKADWSRGLFVSNSGFTEEGLTAFGRAKRLICMDGLDLYEMLERRLPFADVLARKVRRAAENGKPFNRVRDLYT